MTSRQQFSPLCDLHHTFMQRVMVEEDSEDVRSYHTCERRDCTRIFRDFDGYTDLVQGGFDDSRASLRTCPRCGAALYLSEVDHSQKIETWECPQKECDFSGEFASPSAQ
jgi:hypothetical protein